jgi:hypothetical protein
MEVDCRNAVDGRLTVAMLLAVKVRLFGYLQANAVWATKCTVTDLHDPVRKDLVDLQNTLNEARSLLTDVRVVVRANNYKIDDTIENLRILD